MKKLLLLLSAFAALGLPARAQNYTAITAALIQSDAGGTPLAAGHIKFISVNNTGQPISFQVGGGGQAMQSVVSCTVVAGAITTKDGGGTCQLANTALTNPINVCFQVHITDSNQGGADVTGPGYGCYQPTGSSNSFDAFIPNEPGLVVQTIVGGGGAGVISFKGRTGTVVPASGDYAFAQITGLAAVAGSGAYSDLSGKPTIPAAQVNPDWNALSGLAQILNKPTILSGTVTSVALTLPGDFSVAGSPVTSNGTFTVTRANQSANLFLAGPSSGAAAAPAYRAIAVADVPTLNQSTTGNAATASALTAGTLKETFPCILDTPTIADSGRCQFDKSYAYTIVRVYCNVTGAATAVPVNLEQRTEAASDTATSGILTSNLSCVPGGASTTSFSGTVVPAHTPLAITIPSALTGAPTNIRVHVDVARN